MPIQGLKGEFFMKKTAFYIVATLWCTAPVFAVPSHTSATFPANGFMLEDYTYTNAATSTNMAGVYENSVNANPNYDDCPANSWCDSSGQHACSTLDGSYTLSAIGSTANTACYKSCTVATANIAHATAVTGNDYYGAGTDTCSATSCENGYHVADLNSTIGTVAGSSIGYQSNSGTGSNNNQSTFGLTENGTFGVTYSNNKGTIKGRSQCSSQVPANPWYNDANYTFSEGNIVSTLSDSTGQYCWCTLDEYTPVDGAPMSLSGPWVFYLDRGTTSLCAYNCATYCASSLGHTNSLSLAFRSAVLGSMTGGAATCEITDITVEPGYYLPAGTETPVQCTAGNYCPGLPNPVHYDADNNQDITQCAAGSFSAAGASECTVCPADTYSAAGATACTSCATNYHITGNTFANHDSATDCTITCNGGYYLRNANDTTCTAVGAGKYAPASTIAWGATGTFSTCPSGLTTIGYGPGADESGDCGHKFHAGDGVLYLRSTKKTDLALNVRVGDAIFYGNMSTSEKNMSDGTTRKLKIKHGDTVYHVYDDSVDSVGIPADYTPVEYIQSSGSSYINTGFIPAADFKHTLVFESVSSSNSQKYICGTGVEQGRSGNLRITGNALDGLYINTGSAVNVLQSNQTISGKNTIVMDLHNNAQNTVLLNGQKVSNDSSVGTITSTKQLQLFALSDTYIPSGIRIYSSVIEQGGALIRNFVPVKRASDNVCGMYDTVSRAFFGSATNTAFICPTTE